VSSDARFLFFHLGLGRRPDLDDRHATSLAEPLLQLLAVVLGRRVLDLRSQLLDAAVGQNAVISSPESSSGLGYVYASNPVPPFSRRRECLGVAHKQVRLDRSVIPHQTKLVARLVVRREDTPHAIGRRPENGELRETCQCQEFRSFRAIVRAAHAISSVRSHVHLSKCAGGSGFSDG
jgi:hypothetical protein